MAAKTQAKPINLSSIFKTVAKEDLLPSKDRTHFKTKITDELTREANELSATKNTEACKQIRIIKNKTNKVKISFMIGTTVLELNGKDQSTAVTIEDYYNVVPGETDAEKLLSIYNYWIEELKTTTYDKQLNAANAKLYKTIDTAIVKAKEERKKVAYEVSVMVGDGLSKKEAKDKIKKAKEAAKEAKAAEK